MSHGPHHHKHMKDLMTMARKIEPPRAPPLRDPANIKHGPDQVRQSHGRLVGQDHVPVGIIPVEHEGVARGEYAEEAHGDEEQGPQGAVSGCGEGGGEEGDDGAYPEGGDDGEIEDLPVWGALEDVVDWWEEGGDDHDCDTRVVEVEEAEVEAVGVAGEEVASGAREEAEHRTAQEDVEWPVGG